MPSLLHMNMPHVPIYHLDFLSRASEPSPLQDIISFPSYSPGAGRPQWHRVLTGVAAAARQYSHVQSTLLVHPIQLTLARFKT